MDLWTLDSGIQERRVMPRISRTTILRSMKKVRTSSTYSSSTSPLYLEDDAAQEDIRDMQNI